MTHSSTLMRVSRILAVSAFCLFFQAAGADAQNLLNSTNGTICNYGTIEFRTSSGTLTNNNSTFSTTNMTTGTIQFDGITNTFNGSNSLGASTALRVPGLVNYASASSASQSIQARYYSSLEMTNSGTKAIPDAVYVSVDYSAAGGNRTYNGTFYYDGGNQNVFGENGVSGGTNRYNNLSLINGGTKTVTTGSIVLDGGLFSSSTTALVMNSSLTVGTSATLNGTVLIANSSNYTVGTSASTFNNLVTVTSGSLIANLGGSSIVISSSGSLVLVTTNTGAITLASGIPMTIYGSFANNSGTTANLSFDCNSFVVYAGSGAQTLVSSGTVSPNSYGNLTTLNGTKTANGNVGICGNLLVNGGNIDMVTTASYLLTMITHTSSVTFANASEEVIGRMRRTVGATNFYTLNNTNSTFTFTSVSKPTYVEFNSIPNYAPSNFVATTDINRKVNLSYAGSTDWIATVSVGYTAAETGASWAPTTSESTLRFYESSTTSASIEKVATADALVTNVYTRTTTGTMHALSLVNVHGTTATTVPNGLKYVASGMDLLMRGGPTTFNAIADGRWSNPNTWDEGVQPSPTDFASIDGYTVHVGYLRTNDNYPTGELYPTSLSAGVTIGSTLNSSLLFGGTGPFALSPGATLTNNRLAPTCVSSTTADTGSSSIDGGIVVYGGSTMSANTILNNGSVSNSGVIKVGD